MKYIDVSFVEEFLNRKFDSTTNPSEDLLNKYIELAEYEFESKIGKFSEDTEVYTLRGVYYGLSLDTKPIISVNNIWRNSGSLIQRNWTLIDSKDYIVDDYKNGIIFLRYPNPNAIFRVNVTYGYTFEEMPLNIKRLVCLYTLRHIFNDTIFSTNGSFGSQEEIIDVDLYRKVTNKSAFTDSGNALNDIITKAESEFGEGLKSYYINSRV